LNLARNLNVLGLCTLQGKTQIQGKQSRQTGSAVESFRNEMVRGNQDFMQTLTLAKNNNLRKIKNETERHDSSDRA
jgi:hypothetical protein